MNNLEKLESIADIKMSVKEELGEIFSELSDEEINEFNGELIVRVGNKYGVPDFTVYQAKVLRDEYNHKVKFENKVVPALKDIIDQFGKGFDFGLHMYTSNDDIAYLSFKPSMEMNLKQANKNFKKGIENIKNLGAKIITSKSKESGRYNPSKTEIKLNYKGTTFDINYSNNPFAKIEDKTIIEIGHYINKK